MARVQAMRFEGLGLKAVMQLEGSITPFPGGIVASGSKLDTYIDAVAAATKDEIQI